MHYDMQRSAVALGALLVLSRLQMDFSANCWLTLSSNLISAGACRPHDVVAALDGTTMEIINTDAEERLLLADTSVLAVRAHPTCVIDYATLTGTRYSGTFTNRPQWHENIIQAGRHSGEWIWPFPMDTDYGDELERQIADINRCTKGSEADPILATRFLNHFVPETIPWVPFDPMRGKPCPLGRGRIARTA